LGDQGLELLGNRGHDLRCLGKRSRDVEVCLGLCYYSGRIQHVEDVALGEVRTPDMVRVPFAGLTA
jgi:hypothetical protein